MAEFYFDGSASINSSNVTGFPSGTLPDFTIQADIKSSASIGSFAFFLQIGIWQSPYTKAAGGGCAIALLSDGTLTTSGNNDGATTVLNDGAWHTIQLVQSAGVLSAYIDGNGTPEFTLSPGFNLVLGTWSLGHGVVGGGASSLYATGSMRNILVKAGSTTVLELSGTSLPPTDTSGQGNDGTNSGVTLGAPTGLGAGNAFQDIFSNAG